MNKKKILGICAICALFSIGSTLAWRDVNQHKTNKFGSDAPIGNLVLIEEFDEVTKWSVDQGPIKKAISVRNGQDTDNQSLRYDDGFVRIQLREFMAISDSKIVYSEYRYMINENGDFITGDSKESVLAKARLIDNAVTDSQAKQQPSAYDSIQEISDGGKWYIQTNNKTSHGIYGKFVVVEISDNESGYKSVKTNNIVDIDAIDSSLSQNHNSDDGMTNEEDLSEYETHIWDDTESDYTPLTNNYKPYVSLALSDAVITLDQWVASGSKPVKKWIIDINSQDGWVYWGTRLRHGTLGSVELGTQTENFLESVSLRENPDGSMVYRIHVNMDAVSKNELDTWNAPQEIVDAFDNDELYWGTLIESISLGNKKIANATRLERYVPGSKDKLSAILEGATIMVDGLNANTQLEIDEMTRDVLDGIQGFKLNINIDGPLAVNTRIRNFGGRDWTIVNIDQNGNALIVGDIFNKSELKKYGDPNQQIVNNEVNFNGTAIDFGQGYETSFLKKINESYYADRILGTKDELFVEPTILNYESAFDLSVSESLIYDRVDGLSQIDQNGQKVAFTLSISDWNFYSNRNKMSEILGAGKVWTRTPGLKDSNGTVSTIITMMSQ